MKWKKQDAVTLKVSSIQTEKKTVLENISNKNMSNKTYIIK